MLDTFHGEMEKLEMLETSIRRFFEEVENNGLHE
jgi:hypothetical protein